MPDKKALIAALLKERAGYERYGRKDKVAEVDAELKKLGANPKPPAKRATKLQKPKTEL